MSSHRIASVILAALAALCLSACGSSPTATTSAAQSATSTTAAPTSTTTTTTTTTTSSELAALVELCADHCEGLKAIGSLPGCHDGVACTLHLIDADNEVTVFEAAADKAGVDLNDYPNLGAAVVDWHDYVDEWNSDLTCPTFQTGDADAPNCATQMFLIKTQTQLIGMALENASLGIE